MNLAETFSLRSNQSQVIGNGLFSGWFGGSITKNGTPVNNNSALTLSAFFNAVDIISNDYAKLPKHVYQQTAEGPKRLSKHPIQKLISIAPNQYQMSFMFDKAIVLDAILKGNGYAYIERNNGQPVSLQYIDQSETQVEVVKSQNKLWYKVGENIIASDDMYHLPGFSLNGITGIGIVSFAAQSLGTSLSSQEFGSDYYNTKGVGVGVLETDKQLNPAQKLAYSTGFNTAMSKTGQWKSSVLDEGMKYNNLTITAQEAAFLETNKAGVAEIARFLNIPLHKLKLLDNVNNSITENLEIGYVNDSILPWAIKGEKEYTRKLFSPSEIETQHYVKYAEGALLRADKKSQAEFYSKMTNSKLMTPKEVRDLEELPFIEGTQHLLQPVNLMTDEQFQQKLKISETSKKTKNE